MKLVGKTLPLSSLLVWSFLIFDQPEDEKESKFDYLFDVTYDAILYSTLSIVKLSTDLYYNSDRFYVEPLLFGGLIMIIYFIFTTNLASKLAFYLILMVLSLELMIAGIFQTLVFSYIGDDDKRTGNRYVRNYSENQQDEENIAPPLTPRKGAVFAGISTGLAGGSLALSISVVVYFCCCEKRFARKK